MTTKVEKAEDKISEEAKKPLQEENRPFLLHGNRHVP
jgi:hypothetical protein